MIRSLRQTADPGRCMLAPPWLGPSGEEQSQARRRYIHVVAVAGRLESQANPSPILGSMPGGLREEWSCRVAPRGLRKCNGRGPASCLYDPDLFIKRRSCQQAWSRRAQASVELPQGEVESNGETKTLRVASRWCGGRGRARR